MRSAEMRPTTRLLGACVLLLSVAALAAGEAALEALGELSSAARTPEGRVCSYKLATGRPCLGCGGTRAFASVARGDLGRAANLNPLGAWAGFALWLLAFGAAATVLTGRRAALLACLGLVVALGPAAFVWDLVRWWAS